MLTVNTNAASAQRTSNVIIHYCYITPITIIHIIHIIVNMHGRSSCDAINAPRTPHYCCCLLYQYLINIYIYYYIQLIDKWST